MSPLRRALAAALAVAAAGCTGDDPASRPRCPEIAILADAAGLVRFAPGGGQDLTDVDHEAEIIDFAYGCRYEGDPDDFDRVLLVGVAPVIEAVRGPANTDRQASFEYFVTLTDGGRRVVNKQTFGVALTFPGNQTRVTLRDDEPPITITIPAGAGTSPFDYRIFVGFQLTPAELEFNRRRRGALG